MGAFLCVFVSACQVLPVKCCSLQHMCVLSSDSQYQHCKGGMREQVFICKPILESDRTNIVLANDVMLGWARAYLPNRVLVVDTTFGVNVLAYPLLVVMVVDEHGCGLLIAASILKHQSELEFYHALTQLDLTINEGRVVLIKPACYMTDCDKAEINALRYAPSTLRL